MTATTTPSATPIATAYQKVSRPNFIKIDLDSLLEYAGLKPTDVITSVWNKDQTLPPVQVEDLMKLVEIKKSELKGNPPIALTFRTAVQYMVDLINEFRALNPGKPEFPLLYPRENSIHSNIHYALANCETPRQYRGKICSTEQSNLNFLDGAIIHMLYEQGHIASYGRKGTTYWVEF